MEKIKKKDFIELEYTGKTEDGTIFDTNIKKQAEKIGLDIKTRPLIICIGQNMILQSIDEFLIDKEIGKKYNLELEPDKAFGKRNQKLIKTMPLSVFKTHNINPQPGMVFNFDNQFGKVIAGGSRVIVDFNNPLAGKKVIYDLKTNKKITDIKEKVKAVMFAFFRKEFEFEIKEKKLIIKTEEKIKQVLEIFKDKFKEILDLELEVVGTFNDNKTSKD